MYKRISKLFWQLLWMYPFIVLLFASGKIVGALMASGSFTLADGTAASGAAADIIKNAVLIFAAVLPLIALPWAFGQAGSMIGKVNSRVTGFLGKGTQGFREGAVSRVGNTQWAQNTKLGQITSRGLDLVSGNWAARTTQQTADSNKAELEEYNARRSSRVPLLGRIPGNTPLVGGIGTAAMNAAAASRAAGFSTGQEKVGKRYEAAQTSFDEDVLGKNGIDSVDFFTKYGKYLQGKGDPTMNGTIIDPKTKRPMELDFRNMTRLQRRGMMKFAATNGNVAGIDSMRRERDTTKDDASYQSDLTEAIMSSDGKALAERGGRYLLNPAYADKDAARSAVINSFDPTDPKKPFDAAAVAALSAVSSENLDIGALLDAGALRSFMELPPSSAIRTSNGQQTLVSKILDSSIAIDFDPKTKPYGGRSNLHNPLIMGVLGGTGIGTKGWSFSKGFNKAADSTTISTTSPNFGTSSDVNKFLQARTGYKPGS